MKKAFLVGHGNMEIKKFVDLLRERMIEMLIDIRSIPYSQFASQFNRENLKKILAENNIKYLYMGDILGGKHPEGFNKYMNSHQFSKGIATLKKGISSSTSAIMCSETDYTKCHRRFIGLKLADEEFNVEDISKKGISGKITQKTFAGF